MLVLISGTVHQEHLAMLSWLWTFATDAIQVLRNKNCEFYARWFSEPIDSLGNLFGGLKYILVVYSESFNVP